MDGYEIIDKLNNIVNTHWEFKSSVHQQGYKDDIFRLFLEAYRGNYFEPSAHPRLTGDAVRDIFFARYYTQENKEEEKLKVLNAILNKWDEWYYALNKIGAEL
ncbi:MAG: hypothetical protein NTX36_02850 [Proteobacteria bacterium]|nr:hypothetical protein [Pseudomonadota bacterium]